MTFLAPQSLHNLNGRDCVSLGSVVCTSSLEGHGQHLSTVLLSKLFNCLPSSTRFANDLVRGITQNAQTLRVLDVGHCINSLCPNDVKRILTSCVNLTDLHIENIYLWDQDHLPDMTSVG